MRMKKPTTELVAEVLAGSRASCEVAAETLTFHGRVRYQQSADACGCGTTQQKMVSGTTRCNSAPGVRDRAQTREGRSADAGCATDSRIAARYDWNAFLPLLDRSREVVEVEDGERAGRGPRLKIVADLEVVEATAPWSDSLDIGAEGPGGLPVPPLGIKSPKMPLVGGTSIKAPKQQGQYLPVPIPQAKQSNNYAPPDTNWHSGARYRRYTVSKGQCSGSKENSDFWDGQSGEKAVIHDSYAWAYQVIRSAELEMAEWVDRSQKERMEFWTTYKTFLESTPETWFGAVSAGNFDERFMTVYATLAAWSFRFRHGFYSSSDWGLSLDRPVLLSCRPDKNGAAASHNTLNEIELKNDFFESVYGGTKTPVKPWQILVMIHEMGHHSRQDLSPVLAALGLHIVQGLWNLMQDDILVNVDLDDQQDSGCNWISNGEESKKCYAVKQLNLNARWEGIAVPFAGQPLDGPLVTVSGKKLNPAHPSYNPAIADNPLMLVSQSNGNVDGAEAKMLGNIDNYVGYMWNRWLDHGYCKLNVPS